MSEDCWETHYAGQEEPVRPLGLTWSPALPTWDGGLLPEHWYRSDGPLWQDAGITPAVNDDDPVGRWEDKTANADHVNQAVGANMPTLQNGVGETLNGHPVIRFDGTNDYLQGAFTTGGIMNQPNTIFAVAMLDPAAVNEGVYNCLIASTGPVCEAYDDMGPAPDSWAIYAGVAIINGSNTDAEWNVWTILYAGASSQFWHNGITEASGNAGASGMSNLYIGSRAVPDRYWKGDFTEVIMYDAELSDDDKNTVGRYLAIRYGLTYTDI